MNISDATIEELKAEIERRERGHSVRMIELRGPDADGDYGYTTPSIVKVMAGLAKVYGYDPDRLAREVAVAPCSSHFVLQLGCVMEHFKSLPLYKEWFWLNDMIKGEQTPRTNHDDAARAAGWIV